MNKYKREKLSYALTVAFAMFCIVLSFAVFIFKILTL